MRIAWEFNGWKFDINPTEDSGWVVAPITSEQNPINRKYSTIQNGGLRSARRQIQGTILGAISADQYDKFDTWLRNRTVATLTDHLGNSRKAMLMRFEATSILDIRAWKLKRQSYKYSAEWIEMR